MKKIILTSIMGIVILNANDKFSLTISVDKLRCSKGVVQFSIYNKDKSIPNDYYKKQKANINNKSSQTIFKNLPKGKYAISILHDEDLDGEIDKGMILPKEGVGFSNYKSINILNKPTFKKASFELNKDTKKKITVIYF